MCPSHELPTSKAFSLSILTDLYWRLSSEYSLEEGSPVATAESIRTAGVEGRRNVFQGITQGREIEVSEEAYKDMDQRVTDAMMSGNPLPAELASITSTRSGGGQYFVQYEEDAGLFATSAAGEITAVTLANETTAPQSGLRCGELTIQVGNPALLAHALVGTTWPSAIYG